MEKLLSLKEAAPFIGWSAKTIQNKIYKKELKIAYVKLPGGEVMFKPSEIEKYQQQRTVLPVN